MRVWKNVLNGMEETPKTTITAGVHIKFEYIGEKIKLLIYSGVVT